MKRENTRKRNYAKHTQVGHNVNRGGTRGFRAPEILLKVIHQTTAIDIWSAGIIFLSMLCNRFPVLSQCEDDYSLLEITAGLAARKKTFFCSLFAVVSLPAFSCWRQKDDRRCQVTRPALGVAR
jgi:serine/threonine protein kinase